MDATTDQVLQNIFRWHQPVLRQRKLPLKHLKALDAIVSCRTAERGTSLFRCEAQGTTVALHHACKHRSCWQCAQREKSVWVDTQQQRLINCAHFHVVFTLPQEYRVLWQYNTAWFTRTFFSVANATLMQLMKDPKHQGVTPGVLMALHTWGRQLSLHPHIHCVVTAGGETRAGKWKNSGDYLLPIAALTKLYRGKWQSLIREAFENGELLLPPDQNEHSFRRLHRSLYKKPWNVRIEPKYAHGRGVMLYLSRYLRGGPIHPRQIERCDADAISFRYKDHRTQKTKLLTLKPSEFIRRLLTHVPETGQHVVRHYGLYGGAARRRRDRCRAQLGYKPEQKPDARPREPLRCRCGAALRHLRIIQQRQWRKGNSLKARVLECWVQQGVEPVTAKAEKTSLQMRL
jgi:hypothetical protein